MNTYILKKAKAYTFCVCLLLIISCNTKTKNVEPVSINEQVLKLYVNNLSQAINSLDAIITAKTTKEKKSNYIKARKHFKLAEPILAYVDNNNFKSLNAPNILIIAGEESFDTRVMNPFGFQVVEEALYSDIIDRELLNNVTNTTSNRLKLLKTNAHLQLKKHNTIWLLRNQITRIATTGITGFDSPALNQSLVESAYTYQTIIELIKLNEAHFKSKELLLEFVASIEQAQKILNHDFDTFDRFDFIKTNINEQLKLLVKIQEDWNVDFPFEMALSNNMNTLFSQKTINQTYLMDNLSDTTQINKKIAFGKALFNDKSLSKDYSMACASCHIKELAFTDGKKVFNKNQTRNSPTLTYAAYQNDFFLDSRTGSLEGQVIGVVNNHNEFNMTMDSIVQRVVNNPFYKNQIDSLYNNKRTSYNIRHAIASYIRTLNTFDSKFDKNIRGEENTLTTQEKKGFNLFMGKALCATCHFAPIFNGTVPPRFKDTELEAIGVPHTTDTINPILSKDLGRYNVYKTEARKHFFKTPTIRNIALTAPYMHNGVYQTLEEVVDFYNKGGGVGLGIDLPNQTLPFDNLNLSGDEQQALIAFMKTLTDAHLVSY
ncbi:cytochrome c peroxidase [Postechiella marina]|uniref:Cytochrome c peroxidase n=1 Tax=Postechiella marina TaxID=943941 RepID=A0ABP8CIF2_9FLAO